METNILLSATLSLCMESFSYELLEKGRQFNWFDPIVAINAEMLALQKVDTFIKVAVTFELISDLQCSSSV